MRLYSVSRPPAETAAGGLNWQLTTSNLTAFCEVVPEMLFQYTVCMLIGYNYFICQYISMCSIHIFSIRYTCTFLT